MTVPNPFWLEPKPAGGAIFSSSRREAHLSCPPRIIKRKDHIGAAIGISQKDAARFERSPS